MPTNQGIIDAFLKSLGLSAAQRAGVEGNLLVESNFSPTASNPREGAIGIAQWEGGRRTALQQFAAAQGKPETDLMTQLQFLGTELRGSESAAMSALLKTDNPTDAATVFDQKYERSSPASLPARQQAAQALYGSSLTNVLTDPLGSVSNAADAAAPALSGWAKDALRIGLYVLGTATAAGLFIVGAVHTVSEKG